MVTINFDFSSLSQRTMKTKNIPELLAIRGIKGCLDFSCTLRQAGPVSQGS